MRHVVHSFFYLAMTLTCVVGIAVLWLLASDKVSNPGAAWLFGTNLTVVPLGIMAALHFVNK